MVGVSQRAWLSAACLYLILCSMLICRGVDAAERGPSAEALLERLRLRELANHRHLAAHAARVSAGSGGASHGLGHRHNRTAGADGSGAAPLGRRTLATYDCPEASDGSTHCAAPGAGNEADPYNCVCASTRPPHNLAVEDTPLFILITWDDGLTPVSVAPFEEMMAANSRSPDGCPVKTTFFVSSDYTEWHRAHLYYEQGHEIAVHTISHDTGHATTQQQYKDEILGCKLSLSVLGRVPEEEIVGFRFPYLAYAQAGITALYENGMLYDSSISEYGNGAVLSQDKGTKIFPYSYDHGSGTWCEFSETDCIESWTYPGLWSIPMWSVDNEDGSPITVMDTFTAEELIENLHYRLDGNRHPMGLFLHGGRQTAEKLITFVEYAHSIPGVYFVTNRQLIEWMRDPNAPGLDGIAEWLGCAGTPTGYQPRPAPPCNTVTSCQVSGQYMTVCGTACPDALPETFNYKTVLCGLDQGASCSLGEDCICGADTGDGTTDDDGVNPGSAGYWEYCGDDNLCTDCWPGSSGPCRQPNPGICYAMDGDSCPSGTTQCCEAAPHDCTVSEWSAWTACDGECDSSEYRTREVVSPAADGGADCPELMETRDVVDCVSGDWGEWGTCDTQCGDGVRSRQRTILVEASPGGAECTEDMTSEEACVGLDCPIDCEYSAWAEWSGCTAECGGGSRARSRGVSIEAAHGGVPCEDDLLEETEDCGSDPCAVDCSYEPWAEWGDCSAECDGGSRARTRGIAQQGAHGGVACDASSLEETEGCNSMPCPVDCVLSEWAPYGSCSANCGGGIQDRERSIVTPGAHGGVNCSSVDLTEQQACNEISCDEFCAVGPWGEWAACTTDCGGGTRSRSRQFEVDAAIGAAECVSIILVEDEECNSQACPEDCGLSEWGTFDACSANCGGGMQERQRSMATSGSHDGSDCSIFVLVEQQACNELSCAEFCATGPWSEWASCTSDCGGGTRSRTRQFDVDAAISASECDSAVLAEEEDCNLTPCPVDCVLSEWGEFGDCSTECGGGVKQRSRSVLTAAEFGGSDCASDLVDEAPCNEHPCIDSCALGEWGPFGDCSAECGGGTRVRVREFIDGESDGEGCDPAERVEEAPCNTEECVEVVDTPTLPSLAGQAAGRAVDDLQPDGQSSGSSQVVVGAVVLGVVASALLAVVVVRRASRRKPLSAVVAVKLDEFPVTTAPDSASTASAPHDDDESSALRPATPVRPAWN